MGLAVLIASIGPAACRLLSCSLVLMVCQALRWSLQGMAHYP